MTVQELTEKIQGTIVAGAGEVTAREVRGAYTSDLLSDVMANSHEADVWVTLQKHVNIVAVAQLKGIAAIVLVNGRRPDEDTSRRAETEKIPIISTPLPAFEVSGLLYALELRGRRQA